MAELTDKELKILSKEIDKQGLTYTQLQKELLDHLCCDIEAKMEEGIEFLKAFEEVRQRLGLVLFQPAAFAPDAHSRFVVGFRVGEKSLDLGSEAC